MRPTLTKHLTRLSNRIAIATAVVLLGLAVSLGCNGDNDTTSTGPPGLPPNFRVTLGDNYVRLAPGQRASIAIQVDRDSYEGTITLAVAQYGYDGASGVAATIEPASLSPGETSATLVLSVAQNARAGGFALRVDAAVAGMGKKSASVAIAIDPGAPGILISCSEQDMRWEWFIPGHTFSRSCTITRAGGYHGAADFSVEGKLPPGVVVTFDPNPLPPTMETMATLTLIFTLADNAALGGAYFTILVRGKGIPDESFQSYFSIHSPG